MVCSNGICVIRYPSLNTSHVTGWTMAQLRPYQRKSTSCGLGSCKRRDLLIRHSLGVLIFILTYGALQSSLPADVSSDASSRHAPPDMQLYAISSLSQRPTTTTTTTVTTTTTTTTEPLIPSKTTTTTATTTNKVAANLLPAEKTPVDALSPPEEDDNRMSTSSKTEKPDKFAIFYNVYFPLKKIDIQHRIIKSQIDYIRNSSWRNDTIYYNLIGHNESNICEEDHPACHRLGYFEKGWEDITLTSLLRYCRKNPTHTVSYIHNKGSLNTGPKNDRARRLAMTSVFSDACRYMQHPFNVCGFKYHIFPYSHFSTNFFTARCSYVQHLIPPSRYLELRKQFCAVMLEKHSDQSCNTTMMPPEKVDRYSGFGRFAMERWLFIHPTVVPGHVFDLNLLDFPSGLEEWTPKLMLPGGTGYVQPSKTYRNRIKQQLRQFYFLYGEFAPPVGLCRVTLKRVKPPLCDDRPGPGFNFESIHNDTVAPMLRNFE